MKKWSPLFFLIFLVSSFSLEGNATRLQCEGIMDDSGNIRMLKTKGLYTSAKMECSTNSMSYDKRNIDYLVDVYGGGAGLSYLYDEFGVDLKCYGKRDPSGIYIFGSAAFSFIFGWKGLLACGTAGFCTLSGLVVGFGPEATAGALIVRKTGTPEPSKEEIEEAIEKQENGQCNLKVGEEL